jgi:lysyl-tRNA synthetase class 2
MKRLLAAGSGDIYQICRVFRDDELGRWHQPEFTLLEWYRVGLSAAGIDVPAGLRHDALLDLALCTVVIAGFDAAALVFVYDYPASQAALARVKPGHPPVAARFEVFSRGIELANGFHELGDANEQRRRFVADLDARRRANRHVPPLDEELLAALAAGLPDCAGVAVGLDRLIALATGQTDVASALSLAHLRPGDLSATA